MRGAPRSQTALPALHPAVDPTDPYASLDYAARLMHGYINHFGDWRRALVAYNAGPGRLMAGTPRIFRSRRFSLIRSGAARRYVATILGR